MDVRKKLRNTFDGIVLPTLLDTVCERYQEDVDAGAFEAEETDYATAMNILGNALSEEDKALLSDTEYLNKERRCYAAKHGLNSGIAYGFAHCLNADASEDFNFNHSVCKGLLEIPGMERHVDFYEATQTSLANFTVFEETLSSDLNEHVVSVACAWDQRIYSAARDAFYLGYQAAYWIMEQLHPTISIQKIGKILELEFELGYTDAYYRREVKKADGN